MKPLKRPEHLENRLEKPPKKRRKPHNSTFHPGRTTKNIRYCHSFCLNVLCFGPENGSSVDFFKYTKKAVRKKFADPHRAKKARGASLDIISSISSINANHVGSRSEMEGFSRAQHQAAGHNGMLVDASGSLFVKPTVQQEIDFYISAVNEKAGKAGKAGKDRALEEEEEEQSQLTDWIPVFVGTLQQGITQQAAETQKVTKEIKELDSQAEKRDEKPYIVLKNLLHGFRNPSIIDIKLGKVLHDENTAPEKVDRLQKVSETTTSGSHHYRVCGMKLYHSDLPDLSKFKQQDHVKKSEEGYITFDKWYGRALNSKTLRENFKLFFTHNNLTSEQRQVVIRNTFTRLQLLYNCLLSEELRIRSGSLFIAYENDPQRWEEMRNDDPIFKDDLPQMEEDTEEHDEDEDDTNVIAPLSLLSLIDFAHAKLTPGQGHDENLIQGIENLINDIDSLIDDD